MRQPGYLYHIKRKGEVIVKPTCLIMAGSEQDLHCLDNLGISKDLASVFKTDCTLYCLSLESLQAMCKDCSEVKALFYLNSFPQSYEEVLSTAKGSNSISHVFRASYDSNRVWLYDKSTVVDCINKEEIPNAIRRVNTLDTWFNTKGSMTAIALSAILILGVLIAQFAIRPSFADNQTKVQNSNQSSISRVLPD